MNFKVSHFNLFIGKREHDPKFIINNEESKVEEEYKAVKISKLKRNKDGKLVEVSWGGNEIVPENHQNMYHNVPEEFFINEQRREKNNKISMQDEVEQHMKRMHNNFPDRTKQRVERDSLFVSKFQNIISPRKKKAPTVENYLDCSDRKIEAPQFINLKKGSIHNNINIPSFLNTNMSTSHKEVGDSDFVGLFQDYSSKRIEKTNFIDMQRKLP